MACTLRRIPRKFKWLGRERRTGAPTLVLLTALCLAAAGCATTVSQLEDARVLGRNDVDVQLGVATPVNLALFDEVRAGLPVFESRVRAASDGGDPLTESEVRQLLRTGVAAVVFAPGLLPELGVRLGIGDGFEVGLRITSTVARVSGKMSLLQHERDGVDLAAVIGLSGFWQDPQALFARNAGGLGEFLQFKMSRGELGAGLLASAPVASWLTLYGGARALLSRISMDVEVLGVEVVESFGDELEVQTEAIMPHVGGTFGLRVGYREVWLSLELTAMYTSYRPTLLGEKIAMGGWLVAPAIGLSFLFQ